MQENKHKGREELGTQEDMHKRGLKARKQHKMKLNS